MLIHMTFGLNVKPISRRMLHYCIK